MILNVTLEESPQRITQCNQYNQFIASHCCTFIPCVTVTTSASERNVRLSPLVSCRGRQEHVGGTHSRDNDWGTRETRVLPLQSEPFSTGAFIPSHFTAASASHRQNHSCLLDSSISINITSTSPQRQSDIPMGVSAEWHSNGSQCRVTFQWESVQRDIPMGVSAEWHSNGSQRRVTFQWESAQSDIPMGVSAEGHSNGSQCRVTFQWESVQSDIPMGVSAEWHSNGSQRRVTFQWESAQSDIPMGVSAEWHSNGSQCRVTFQWESVQSDIPMGVSAEWHSNGSQRRVSFSTVCLGSGRNMEIIWRSKTVEALI